MRLKAKAAGGWCGGFQGPGVGAMGDGGGTTCRFNAHLACWFRRDRVAARRILTA